jgi:hypothetical protein
VTLVLNAPSAGPGTHVLIVGVGEYPHLVGGSGVLLPSHDNMGQLNSPPVSARAVATWFLAHYNNPARQLSSLDLLISDPSSATFTAPDRTKHRIERATFANTEQAVLAWKARGDTNEANLVVFFFCGHGIASGSQTTLLLEDFGRLPDAPLNHAVDFNALYLGMDKCDARTQCFFVDACRVASGALLTADKFSGMPIIYGSTRLKVRKAPVYYATVPGALAYGRVDAPSVFSEALLKALEGAGSDDFDGDWRIQTDVLNRGIHHLLRRSVDKTAAEAQLSIVDHLTRFALHHLPGRPIVPVEVACDPDDWNQHAVLSFMGRARQEKRMPPLADDWDLDLEEGSYIFSAEIQPPQSGRGSVNSYVGPPYRPVRIGVQS